MLGLKLKKEGGQLGVHTDVAFEIDQVHDQGRRLLCLFAEQIQASAEE
jgi:hypothetical protein